MSALSVSKPENISNLLNMDQEYAAPTVVSRSVLQRDWNGARERAAKDPEGFWAEYAEEFEWSQPWTRVLDWDGIHHKWFLGAKTNITINALDRHANSENGNRAAFIWLGEDGTERIVTYRQLHRQVCRFANGLKSLGVVKGDRVIIYMPLTIEGAIAMLACARIGAIHSVVYAGLGHAALRDRITDAQAKIVIAGDVGYRRGKTVALKAIVDEALEPLDCVEKVIVYLARESRNSCAARNRFQRSAELPVRLSCRAHGFRRSALPALHLRVHGKTERCCSRSRRIHGGHHVSS